MTAPRFLSFLLLVAPASGVCEVPVFRYALERWPAAPYEVLLFHRGPLAAETEAVLREIRDSSANAEVQRTDMAEKPDPALLEFWKSQGEPALPWMTVRFPQSEPGIPAAWSGRPEAAVVRGLLDSPARREIVRRLLLGESVVWLLLECGDTDRDNAAARLLDTELRSLEKTLKLPETDPEDLPLMSDVPLRIAFSALRLSRHDPAEQGFVGMLLRCLGESAEGKGPVVLPVFGRGRALWPLAGEKLSSPEIAEAAEFLAGACSCQVKEMNPGLDLLFDADWEGLLRDPPGLNAPAVPAAAPLRKPAQPPPAAPPAPRPSSFGPAFWAGLAAVAVLVLLVGALLLRPRRPAGPC